MSVNWGAFGVVSVVSLAIGVLVVVLASLALVGLSAREPDHEPATSDETPSMGHDGGKLSPTAGTAVAMVCLLGAAAVVLYGLYVIVF